MEYGEPLDGPNVYCLTKAARLFILTQKGLRSYSRLHILLADLTRDCRLFFSVANCDSSISAANLCVTRRENRLYSRSKSSLSDGTWQLIVRVTHLQL